jgi:hypothetical protein
MKTPTRHRHALRGTAFACAAAAALAMASLLATACSSVSSGQQVTSQGGGTAQGTVVAHSDQDMLKFARCMRTHGVAMPDPAHIPGHAGLSLQFPSSTPSPDPHTLRTANAACMHFIGPIIQAKQAAITPARLAALTTYARCMRAHDIAMLDPTSSGELTLGNVPGISSDFGRESPQFRAADTACRHLLPAGVHDDGTGP